MKNFLLLLLAIVFCTPVFAQNAALPESPFFAICMDTHDTKKRSIEEQSVMLKELGFVGMKHLNLGKLQERVESSKKHGLKLIMVYLTIDVSANPPFDAKLAESLACLKGSDTMLALNINGGKPSDVSLDDKIVSVIQDIMKITQPLGVKVIIYPHKNSLVERVDDSVRIAKRFPNNEVGVMFNLCHWAAYDKSENLEAVIRSTLPYLAAVSINGTDTPEEIQTKNGNWIQPLDSGSYDVSQVLKVLDKINYTGPVGLQCFGIRGDAREHLERSMKKWKEMHAAK
ncbi:MAG: sugar phosphate isomerase/epimerase [Planctomycetaceae bacterium]|jgi:sugar phosphate isomerase/epimerase|nr:sugar phosphate isomerase/epimerase [Planctomycetaceae bacterium]